MFYRVRVNLPFTIEDEANDFYHDCDLALPKSAIINPGQPNEERGYIILEECHHDETPSLPCLIIKEQTAS